MFDTKTENPANRPRCLVSRNEVGLNIYGAVNSDFFLKTNTNVNTDVIHISQRTQSTKSFSLLFYYKYSSQFVWYLKICGKITEKKTRNKIIIFFFN